MAYRDKTSQAVKVRKARLFKVWDYDPHLSCEQIRIRFGMASTQIHIYRQEWKKLRGFS